MLKQNYILNINYNNLLKYMIKNNIIYIKTFLKIRKIYF